MEKVRRSNKRYYYKQLEWWAENGLVYLEDHRDDTFNAFTVRDALEKAMALTVERRRIEARVRASAHSSGNRVAAEEREKLQTAIEGLVAAAKEAKFQGDPSDPKVIEDLRKRRRKNILLPGENPGSGTKQGKILLG